MKFGLRSRGRTRTKRLVSARRSRLRAVWAVAALVAGCIVLYGAEQWPQADAAAAQAAPSPFKAYATIHELMEHTVDPAADGVWEAVAVISNESGVEERRPRTPEEWQEVRRHAIALLEAMNLLVIEGRRVAEPGAEAHFGEHPPEQIDAMIRENRPAFIGFTEGVRQTTLEALAAIDKQDVQGLVVAGGHLDEACEACHLSFWYSIPATVPSASK